MPKNISMQGAMDVDVLNIETRLPEAHLEDCTTTGLNFTAEKVYSMGKGGAYIVGFAHSKRITANIVHGYPTTEILALQSGNDVIVGANTEVIQRDILTVTSDASATTFTALGTANEEIGWIRVVDSNGVFTDTVLEQAATVSAGKFTYTAGTKALTFNASELVDGTKIAVYYKHTTDATAQTIKFDADKFAGNKKVVFNGSAIDNCSKKVYQAQFIFHNGSIGDEFEYSFEETGDAVVQNMSVEALASCGNANMVEFILYDKDLAS